MDAGRVYAQLQDVCRNLDAAEDHVIAAYVEFAMSLIDQKYCLFEDPVSGGQRD